LCRSKNHWLKAGNHISRHHKLTTRCFNPKARGLFLHLILARQYETSPGKTHIILTRTMGGEVVVVVAGAQNNFSRLRSKILLPGHRRRHAFSRNYLSLP
jgi:hypothetical protein